MFLSMSRKRSSDVCSSSGAQSIGAVAAVVEALSGPLDRTSLSNAAIKGLPHDDAAFMTRLCNSFPQSVWLPSIDMAEPQSDVDTTRFGDGMWALPGA